MRVALLKEAMFDVQKLLKRSWPNYQKYHLEASQDKK
jgi:hypothetical protein